MRGASFLSTPALVLIVAACHDGGPNVAYCLMPRPIAVLVTPIDSVTHASLVEGAHGAVQSGAYVDSLRLSSWLGALEGGDKVGTYEITLERPGYQNWIRTNVAVTQQGPCGNVSPVELTALLQPSP